jgi:hypothetical protein
MHSTTRLSRDSKPVQIRVVRAYWDLFFRLTSFVQPIPLYMMILRVALRDICHTGGSWMAEDVDGLNPPLVNPEDAWVEMGSQIQQFYRGQEAQQEQ